MSTSEVAPPKRTEPETFDVIIVGSGFGGSVAACRLAQANDALPDDQKQKVLLLERGRRYTDAKQDFPRLQIPDALTKDDELKTSKRLPDVARALWSNDQGLYDIQSLGRLRVVTAAGLGGGSLAYASVHLRPPPAIFRAGWPAGYSRAALDPYFELVEAMLDVAPVPQSADGDKWTKTKRMASVATESARPYARVPLAINFRPTNVDAAARKDRFGVEQAECVGCGECDTGCVHKAKNTLDRNYLAGVEDKGVRIRTLAEVFRLESVGGGYEVTYRDHLRGGRERTVRAKHVFLCAGAVGSTELLLANKDGLRQGKQPPARTENGAMDALDRVGQSFFANGDSIATIFDTAGEWGPSSGPVITTALYHRENDDGDERWFLLQDGGIPRALGRVLGLFRSPLWMGRNRFEGAKTPAASKAPEGVDARGVARYLGQLRHLRKARVHQQDLAGAEQLAWLPTDLRAVLSPLADPAKALKERLQAITNDTTTELPQEGRAEGMGWLERLVLKGFIKRINERYPAALLNAALDALSKQLPALSFVRRANGLFDLGLDALPALVLGDPPGDRTAVLLAMGPDQAWTLSREGGHTTATSAAESDLSNARLFGAQERLMRDVAGRLDGELRTNPGWTIGRHPVTVHAQGGCAMGLVTESNGQVAGFPGLYVLDGAALPRSVGVNPSSTIAAIAEKNIEAFIHKQLGLAGWSARAAERQRDAGAESAAARKIDDLVVEKQSAWAKVEPALFRDSPPTKARTPSLVWNEVMEGFLTRTDPARDPDPRLPEDVRELDKSKFEAWERRGRRELGHLRADLEATVRNVDERRRRRVVIDLDGTLSRRPSGPRQPVIVTPVKGTLTLDYGDGTNGPPVGFIRYDLEAKDGDLRMAGLKQLRDDGGRDAWHDLSTLHVVLKEGPHVFAGIIRVGLIDFLTAQVPSMRIIEPAGEGVDGPRALSPARKAWLLLTFSRDLFGGLANIYPTQRM